MRDVRGWGNGCGDHNDVVAGAGTGRDLHKCGINGEGNEGLEWER